MKLNKYIVNKMNYDRNRIMISFLLSSLSIGLCVFFNGSLVVGILVALACLVIPFVKIDCVKKSGLIIFALYTLIFLFIMLFLSQLLLNESIFSIGVKNVILGLLCICCIIAFFSFVTLNTKSSLILSSLVVMCLSTANHYVYTFRGNELAPHDFIAFGTAMNVVGNYEFQITIPLLYSWILYFLVLYSLSCFVKEEKKYRCKRIRKGVLLCGLIVAFMSLSDSVVPLHFHKTGTANIGYILNFSLQLKETFTSKPDAYSTDNISDLEKIYQEVDGRDSTTNYIVIMNESFSVFDNLSEKSSEFNEIIDFYNSLENAYKGYALSSIFGGRTPNSEYEFLSGNSMAFLPTGSIAYQQYIKQPSYSLVEILNSLDYQCIAVHPYLANGWMRPYVYENLGFDEMYFLDDFSQDSLIRDFVSDYEMYEWIVDKYENSSKEKQFIFGVTMQNHGGYDYEGYESTVKLNGYSQEYSDVEQYLSLIKESDDALKYMIGYFEKVEEPVVIVFYGDHFPSLNQNFYEEIHGGAFDTLEEQMLQYEVPFFIWSNYDIEDKYIECTSLNYLSNYMFEVAGMEMPVYNQFLKDVEEVIPAMNALGFYSEIDNCFKVFDEANEEEKYWLNLYEQLQYNCLFDKENRSELFFPIPEGE